MPNPKRQGARTLSKYNYQKLQRLYAHVGAAYGTVHKLMRARNLPVSKVKHFFHSKTWITKLTLATSKLKRMKAFAGFKNEIVCLDLAYVAKLPQDNNGVM